MLTLVCPSCASHTHTTVPVLYDIYMYIYMHHATCLDHATHTCMYTLSLNTMYMYVCTTRTCTYMYTAYVVYHVLLFFVLHNKRLLGKSVSHMHLGHHFLTLHVQHTVYIIHVHVHVHVIYSIYMYTYIQCT